MKKLGKKPHGFIKDLMIDIIEFEESDFDFSEEWENNDLDTKANFCSFLGVGFLNKGNRDSIIAWWEYYQLKQLAI